MSTIQNVVVIGSGPAGYTAAIYAARANLDPLVFEGNMAGGIVAGGQLTTTSEVENFPGFPQGINGLDLTDRFREQALHCGAKIETKTVSKVDLATRPFKLWTEGEEEAEPVLTNSVIIATGATARKLNVPGVTEFWNKGISACAVCDGPLPLFRKQPLAVIGGGDTACEEALFLSRFASKVYLIHRRDSLRASKVMAQRATTHEKIEVLWNSQLVSAQGDEKSCLGSITIETKGKTGIDGEASSLQTIPVKGLFFAIGHEPNSSVFKPLVSVDADNYIITTPGTTNTSVEGVFAAGDVQDKKYRQAITAAGSGCMAALECERWLQEHLHQ
eukprot:GILJ01002831.1.p1 GENE.GILJ01002831.1~~GILJ01002831.1.p1  ORF type:complete len:363 (+),score=49.07 GILJ01002831.1:98-1090(+)